MGGVAVAPRGEASLGRILPWDNAGADADHRFLIIAAVHVQALPADGLRLAVCPKRAAQQGTVREIVVVLTRDVGDLVPGGDAVANDP